MIKRKWLNPEIPLEVLALKLCEEAAEVGTEITDAIMSGELLSYPFIHEAEILVELEHVEFLVSVIRNRVLDKNTIS